MKRHCVQPAISCPCLNSVLSLLRLRLKVQTQNLTKHFKDILHPFMVADSFNVFLPQVMVELELYKTFISDIFESHHYRSSVEFVVLFNQGSLKTIVYAPTYWSIEDGGNNSARDFFYSKV